MRMSLDKALAALDGIGEPFAWCLTDVNRKTTEFTDHPKHKHENDLRIYTALYTTPQPAKVPDAMPIDPDPRKASLYSIGWNAYRDALLSTQEAE